MTNLNKSEEDGRFVDTLCRNTNVQSAISRFDMHRPIQASALPRPRLDSGAISKVSPEPTVTVDDFYRLKTYIPATNDAQLAREAKEALERRKNAAPVAAKRSAPADRHRPERKSSSLEEKIKRTNSEVRSRPKTSLSREMAKSFVALPQVETNHNNNVVLRKSPPNSTGNTSIYSRNYDAGGAGVFRPANFGAGMLGVYDDLMKRGEIEEEATRVEEDVSRLLTPSRIGNEDNNKVRRRSLAETTSLPSKQGSTAEPERVTNFKALSFGEMRSVGYFTFCCVLLFWVEF